MSENIFKSFQKELFPYDKKHFIVASCFSVLYLGWTFLFVGFREDHLTFYLFIMCLFLLHKESRKFAYCFIFFILFWVIYDAMRIYPNYLLNEVNILPPYNIEKFLFGISSGDSVITPNEYLNNNSHVFMDFLSGIFYLTWVPIPLTLGIYLYFTDKKMLLRFSAAYLFANILGFIIYYIYPAAPPWYFAKYGNNQLFNIPGDAASLVRFDEIIQYPLFSSMYTKNANVFAAIPSLHAAYPVITWYYARKKKLFWASLLILIDVAGIWFAAVYSFHHYVIDVILGFGCAVMAILIFEGWVLKTRFSILLDKYLNFSQT